MKLRPQLSLLLLVAASLWIAPASCAQDQVEAQTQPPAQGPAQTPDQPTSSVARLSVVQGSVSTQRGDSGDWSAATVNTPVVPGDRVSTGEHSRAEIQLDFANLLRLDENSVVRVTDLAPQRIQIQVSEGLVIFDAFQNSDSEVEIDTPNLAIHPHRGGVYRIQVNSDAETLVVVRRGEAEMGTAEGSTTLPAGQLAIVRGDSASAQYKVDAAPARDGFDNWSEERDRLTQRLQSSPNINPYYTGGGDLDANGTWRNVPDYGSVWTPNNVPQDWAPYRNGAWVWEPTWGWTWTSYEPWGWAPYHYGRWFPYGGSWAWWPGPVTPYYRPVWAPAYVSFFGFGGRFGVGFGFGSYGWLPIGPADPFYPWWGFGASFSFVGYGHYYGGRGYVAPLAGSYRGRAAFSNLNGLESNARLRAGITSVSSQRFGNGRVVPEGRSIGADEIRGAQFAHGSLPVTPSRGSLSASGRPAGAGTVPARNLNSQHFFARNQPAATQHSFAAESAQFRQQVEQQRSPSANAPGRATGQGFAGGTTRTNENFRQPAARNDGWAQGRSPATAASAADPSANFRGNADGWQRFGAQPNSSGNQAGRGSAPGSPWYRGSQQTQNRPQLDLHQSIVQQRAPSYGSPYGYGRGSAAPAQRPSYSAPRPQPSYRAPAAPHYSAPSAPHGSGGAPRGGGSSHPSGSSHHSGHH